VVLAPLSPGSANRFGSGVSFVDSLSNQVSQQNEKAQLTRGLMAADRGVGADLEVGPAEFVFDLFVALLDPVPDPVEAHDLGQVGRFVQAVGAIVRPAGAGQVGGPDTRWPCPAGLRGLWWRSRAGCARRVPTSPVGRRRPTMFRCVRHGTVAAPGAIRRDRPGR